MDLLTDSNSYRKVGFAIIVFAGLFVLTSVSVSAETFTVENQTEWGNSVENDVRINIDSGSLKLFGEDSIGWWSVDDDSDAVVYDLTSLEKNWNMFNIGTGHYTSSDSVFGNAIDFDGGNDYATTDAGASRDDFTFCFWYSPDHQDTNDGTMFSRNINSQPPATMIRLTNPDDIYLQVHDDEGDGISRNVYPSIKTGEWNFLVVQVDGTTIKMYEASLNESLSLVFSQTFSNYGSQNFSNPLNVARDSRNKNYYDGRFDELAMFNRALTKNEIKNYLARSKPSSMVGDDLKTGTWSSLPFSADSSQQLDNLVYSASVGENENLLWKINEGNYVQDEDGVLTSSEYDSISENENWKVNIKLQTTTTTTSPSVSSFKLNTKLAEGTPPKIENIYTPTTVDPETAYKYRVQIRDNYNLSDIQKVYLKLYKNTLAENTADNKRDHYTFIWTRENGFAENGLTGHLNVDNCSKFSDLENVDNIVFDVSLDTIAKPTDWNAYGKVVNGSSEGDNLELVDRFAVNVFHRISFSEDNITFRGARGEQEVESTVFPTKYFVDTNEEVNIEYKYSGSFTGNSSENVYWSGQFDPDGNPKFFTENYKTFGFELPGENIERKRYWWIDIPENVGDNYRETTLFIRVVSA